MSTRFVSFLSVRKLRQQGEDVNTLALTPREMCFGIKSVCEGEFDHLSPRPWNKFKPDDTLWWLVPATDWPAYRYAKLYFDLVPWEPLCSHLRSARGKRAASVHSGDAYPSRRGSQYIMGGDWAWHRFLEGMGNGSMTKAMGDAVHGTDQVCSVVIYGGYVPDPGSFDPYADDFRMRKSTYRFLFRDQAGACYLASAEDRDRYMDQLKHAKSVAEIAEGLQDLAGNPWLWIDVAIGLSLDVQRPPGSADVTTDADLWSHHLRHLSPRTRP